MQDELKVAVIDKTRQAALLRKVLLVLGVGFIAIAAIIALTDFVPVPDADTRKILACAFGRRNEILAYKLFR